MSGNQNTNTEWLQLTLNSLVSLGQEYIGWAKPEANEPK